MAYVFRLAMDKIILTLLLSYEGQSPSSACSNLILNGLVSLFFFFLNHSVTKPRGKKLWSYSFPTWSKNSCPSGHVRKQSVVIELLLVERESDANIQRNLMNANEEFV